MEVEIGTVSPRYKEERSRRAGRERETEREKVGHHRTMVPGHVLGRPKL